MPAFDLDCPLCRAERLTPRHYEDETCWVADCATCGVPMAVLKDHRHWLTAWETGHVLEKLREVASELSPAASFTITGPRSIPSHAHFHARPSEAA